MEDTRCSVLEAVMLEKPDGHPSGGAEDKDLAPNTCSRNIREMKGVRDKPGRAKPVAGVSGRGGESLPALQKLCPPPGLLSPTHPPCSAYSPSTAVSERLATCHESGHSLPFLNEAPSKYSRYSC